MQRLQLRISDALRVLDMCSEPPAAANIGAPRIRWDASPGGASPKESAPDLPHLHTERRATHQPRHASQTSIPAEDLVFVSPPHAFRVQLSVTPSEGKASAGGVGSPSPVPRVWPGGVAAMYHREYILPIAFEFPLAMGSRPHAETVDEGAAARRSMETNQTSQQRKQLQPESIVEASRLLGTVGGGNSEVGADQRDIRVSATILAAGRSSNRESSEARSNRRRSNREDDLPVGGNEGSRGGSAHQPEARPGHHNKGSALPMPGRLRLRPREQGSGGEPPPHMNMNHASNVGSSAVGRASGRRDVPPSTSSYAASYARERGVTPQHQRSFR